MTASSPSKSKLDAAKGLDRAKVLDQIIEGYEKLGNESEEQSGRPWSKEIIALDADNKAGLKVKYEFPHEDRQRPRSWPSRASAAEAKELMDKALELKGVPAELRQEGYMTKAQISVSEGKFADAVATLKAAKEAAPESPMAKRIDESDRAVYQVGRGRRGRPQDGSRTGRRPRASTAPS